MAISAVLLFESTGDVRKIYDSILDEMGARDSPPAGAIYHWCAPVPGGLQVCDLWETREQFERFAQDEIRPISAKHGLAAPLVEIADVHEFIPGRETSQKGAGMLIDFEGDTDQLLKKIDQVNQRMDVIADPPQGLVFHWTSPAPGGVRVIDHWRSNEDFERFVGTRLSPLMEAVGLPQPRITGLEVYNTLDRRVTAKI